MPTHTHRRTETKPADLHIGAAPAEEECAQVGSDGYRFRARLECWALIQQLRRMLGPEPKGTRLYVRENPHDLGACLSVDVLYPENDEAGMKYALRCEAELPLRWDQEARKYLGLKSKCDGDPPTKRKRSRSPQSRAAEPKNIKKGERP